MKTLIILTIMACAFASGQVEDLNVYAYYARGQLNNQQINQIAQNQDTEEMDLLQDTPIKDLDIMSNLEDYFNDNSDEDKESASADLITLKNVQLHIKSESSKKHKVFDKWLVQEIQSKRILKIVADKCFDMTPGQEKNQCYVMQAMVMKDDIKKYIDENGLEGIKQTNVYDIISHINFEQSKKHKDFTAFVDEQQTLLFAKCWSTNRCDFFSEYCFVQQGAILNQRIQAYIKKNDLTGQDPFNEGSGYGEDEGSDSEDEDSQEVGGGKHEGSDAIESSGSYVSYRLTRK